jgi:hypothetical protein
MAFSLWLFGLLLGMRHALEPDHLAAVSTLVVEQRRMSSGAMLGGLWGIGHTAALLVVATLLAQAGAAMPPGLASAFELGVSVMLVGIGLRTMFRVQRHQGHNEPNDERHRLRLARRSLLIGSVHGLAGSGALTALVASRLGSAAGRLLYVGVFGLGSIIGMALLSGAAGWPLARIDRAPMLARLLTTATGAAACGLGILWGVPLVRDLMF